MSHLHSWLFAQLIVCNILEGHLRKQPRLATSMWIFRLLAVRRWCPRTPPHNFFSVTTTTEYLCFKINTQHDRCQWSDHSTCTGADSLSRVSSGSKCENCKDFTMTLVHNARSQCHRAWQWTSCRVHVNAYRRFPSLFPNHSPDVDSPVDHLIAGIHPAVSRVPSIIAFCSYARENGNWCLAWNFGVPIMATYYCDGLRVPRKCRHQASHFFTSQATTSFWGVDGLQPEKAPFSWDFFWKKLQFIPSPDEIKSKS